MSDTLRKHRDTLRAIAYELRGENPRDDQGPAYKLGDLILSGLEIAEKESHAQRPDAIPGPASDENKHRFFRVPQ